MTTLTARVPASAAAFAQLQPNPMLVWCLISSLSSDRGSAWTQPGPRAQNHPAHRRLSAHQSTPYPNPNALLSMMPKGTRSVRCQSTGYLQTEDLSPLPLCPPLLHPAWHGHSRSVGAAFRTGEKTTVLLLVSFFFFFNLQKSGQSNMSTFTKIDIFRHFSWGSVGSAFPSQSCY